MNSITDIEPRRVFSHFEKICSIPHGSGNEKQISDYLVAFAKENDLRCRQDEKYNVVIWKDGSEGYEKTDAVILQAHMDMVAVKDEGVSKDMETEGLDLVVEGSLLYARGTSLGADDGIGVAYILAVLEDKSLIHPPLEAVFTAGEETDMEGVFHLDVSGLSGRIMINLDSSPEGEFTVGSAGGALASLSIPCSRQEQASDTPRLRLQLDGLMGGHSGIDINLGRLNACVTMGRILYEMSRSMDIRLIDIQGGDKDNTIPTFCEALIAVPDFEDGVVKGPDPSAVKTPAAVRAAALARDIFATIKEEYGVVEPDMELDVIQEYGEGLAPMTAASGEDILCALVLLPNGVQRMSPDIENLVQTSLNLGILSTHEDKVRLEYCVRSSVMTEKMYLIERLRVLTERLSGTLEIPWSFPEWNHTGHSRIREIMADVYHRLYGKDPVINISQGGLECGVFSQKIPGLDVISFGPDLFDIHTTSERADIESIRRTYDLLLNTLEELV